MNAHTRLKEIQSILQRIDQPLEIHIRESLEIERRSILLGLESGRQEIFTEFECSIFEVDNKTSGISNKEWWRIEKLAKGEK